MKPSNNLIQNKEMIPCEQRERIELMEKHLVAIKDSSRRVEIAILGDEEAGVEGLVKRVGRHEKAINTGRRILWSIFGGGAVIVFLWEIIKEIK